ncbi:MAG TPA: Ig-like domain-containing protein [Verrucomicrobiota bacterium]|nr:Ig-like domain-containing protein [Verrucomicrobiota bacterium]
MISFKDYYWQTKWSVIFAITLLALLSAKALTTSDYAVLASAQVKTNPPSITLKWNSDSRATNFVIYRKGVYESKWNLLTNLSTGSTSFIDTNVVVGEYYEYQIIKYGIEGTSGFTGYSWILSAIEAPIIDERGGLVLIVEQSVATNLASEINKLVLDFVGDGWNVIMHNVYRTNSPQEVKALITNDYYASPVPLKAVFLLGRVPVPYSGQIAPDGHSDHVGAWPADVYYADIDGNWTDTSLNYTNSSNSRLTNIPGDGKFDQSYLPSDTELWIGRVDLSNMPAFALNETELLRKYLWKNHNFRFNYVRFQRKGIIDDNFGTFGSEAFAASAWRDFSAFFGSSYVISGDYFTNLTISSYLWSYGCGAGSYTSASGVGTTDQFAQNTVYTAFTMLFGSYHGDWDSQNNFMRASLCYPSLALVCGWSGRPHWHCHHLAIGFPIGFSAWATQNNDYSRYGEGSISKRGVHIALMGDPTLRMHPVSPPRNFRCFKTDGNATTLSWQASVDTIKGYIVYGSTNLTSGYTRLTDGIISSTSFTDITGNYNYYMVKAVKLETSGSGSYFNTSQGVFQSTEQSAQLAPTVLISEPGSNSIFSSSSNIKISTDLFDPSLSVSSVVFYNGDYKLGEITSPPYEFVWKNAPVGIYQIRVEGKTFVGETVQSPILTLTVQQVIIEKGSVWSYLDDGSNQGTLWRTTNYNDSGWAQGAAELGYSNAPITIVNFGDDPNNKYITTYFRKYFYVENPMFFTNLILGLKRDDGAIVYINGEEVVRSNMPQGPVNYQTFASSAVGGSDESTFFIYNLSPQILVRGTNLIAVEVHQNAPSSSDLSFDLFLYGTGKPPELKLDINNTADGRLLLQYPSLTPLIKVQSTTNLFANEWSNFIPSLTQSNGYNVFINSPVETFRYYRLVIEQ